MNDPQECPAEQVLLDYATERLSDDARREFEAHLSSCERCSQSLDWIRVHLLRPTTDSDPDTVGETGPLLPGASGNRGTLQRPVLDDETFDFDVLDSSENAAALGRLGRYDIFEVMGYGGMGVVLRAYDEGLRRTVAIKVLKRSLATSAMARRRFMREGRAAAAVSHPNVVTIHAVEEHRGLPFLVMEHVQGCSLRDRLRADRRLDPIEALRISAQVAAGLAAAHAHGVIHRDIKPGNIMLEDAVARVKITDFGLARAAAIDNVELTSRDLAVGTPAYMAPEQVHGDNVDSRVDLFALGCVMYSMLAGQSPFHGKNALETAHMVLECEPPPLGTIDEKAPRFYCDVVARLLCKDPDKRFQSAAEVADLLNRYLATINQTPTDELAAVLAAGLPTGKRRPRAGLWLIAAVCLLLLAAGGLWLFWLWHEHGPSALPSAGSVPRSAAGSNSAAVPRPPRTITVAASGQAECQTIGQALERASPRCAIQVLDGATYEEAIVIDHPERWEGVSLLATQAAVLTAPGTGTLIAVRDTPGVTVRGFQMRARQSQIGVEIAGPCAGARIEDIDARRVPNAAGTESSPLAFAYIHGGARGTAEAPIVLRNVVVRGGEVGIAIGEQFLSQESKAVGWVRLEECTLWGPGRGTGFHLILMNALENVVVSRCTLADGACGVSFMVTRPHIAREIRVEHNTFYSLTGLCHLNNSELEQDGIHVAFNLIANTESVAVDRGAIAPLAAAWFEGNWWLKTGGLDVAATASVAKVMDGVGFVSEDPANEHYLRPRVEAGRLDAADVPGRHAIQQH